MFKKFGELIEISRVEATDSCVHAVSPEILDNFKKFAANLKKIAPKAEDFLYFSAVMMHAAEAAGLNDDGTPRLTIKGETVQVGWDKTGNTWRWMSNDPGIKPYRNSNGDIFPEEELVKAYKKWVGKPLCIDHKSSSVDHVRGFIVDTYYDRNLKRVIALCALDKAGYPQLARQVATGVSNCVSMGTAVGRAICSDCAKVARTEQDFCDHMRRKSCYGEINVDLNPIELSIVVNGADPKAHIKHIIAAANTLNAYVDNKQKELEKLAEENYVANLSFNNNTNGNDPSQITSINVNAKDLETFKQDVDKAIEEYKKLQSSISEENMQEHTNDLASNQLSEAAADAPIADSGLAPPHERYAGYTEIGGEAIEALREVTAAIDVKLSQMKQNLDKLANTSKNKQEENMSDINKKGYYQGGGGVSEPTPGQAKYPKDPLNEKLRQDEDKQMVGQSPFPEVGPVDGMHPSPESADPSDELQRKKMLARADLEERAVRRNAIVNLAKQKLAYHQGGGGVNEPTPGKPKYPKDKLNEDLRDYEDKQMVGQKPFPGVGPVDGMHPSPASADPSDELKRKQLLSRAGLNGKFVYAKNSDGSNNLGKSAWEFKMGDKVILTASVNDLGGELMYDKVATTDFGRLLMEKIKAQGADKVRSLFKSAQEAAPAAPAVDPAAAPAPDAAPPADAAAPVEDTGGSGDPKEVISDVSEKMRDLVSDLGEAANALKGERVEMGEMDSAAPADMAVAASEGNFSTAALNGVRKEINGALTQAMKEAIANLNDHQQELDMIAGIYDKGAVNNANQEMFGTIVEDALNDAKSAVADGFKLMTAFVKYARGTKAIVKRAEIEAELEAMAEGDNTMSSEQDSNDLMNLIQESNDDLNDIEALMTDDNDHVGEEPHDELAELLGGDTVDANDLMAKPEELKNLDVKPGTEVKVVASFDSKEGRAALRAKLAAEATGKEDDGELQDMSKAKYSDMLDQADRLADGQTKLDVKPSDSLGLVETLPEQKKVMMDVAKAPPKVRKEAEAIHRLVSAGKLDPADIDSLVAEGLDKDAVAYYKKYWAQADGGSEFANELVKEHVKAEMEAEINKFKVKLARAYELAYDMVDRGLCHFDRNAVSAQVDEIMKFNDEGFESLKRVVAKNPVVNIRKEAGRMPQVGMFGSGEVNTNAPSDDNLYAQLSAAFSKTSKRSF